MTESETRRRRLRHWIDTDPNSMGNVEQWCSHYSQFSKKPLSPTYIRQLAPEKGKAARNIGERTARNLEAIGGKPRGWLDVGNESSDGMPATSDVAALTAEAAEIAGMWLQLRTDRRESIRAAIVAELDHTKTEKRRNAWAQDSGQNQVRQNDDEGSEELAWSKKIPAGKTGVGE